MRRFSSSPLTGSSAASKSDHVDSTQVGAWSIFQRPEVIFFIQLTHLFCHTCAGSASSRSSSAHWRRNARREQPQNPRPPKQPPQAPQLPRQPLFLLPSVPHQLLHPCICRQRHTSPWQGLRKNRWLARSTSPLSSIQTATTTGAPPPTTTTTTKAWLWTRTPPLPLQPTPHSQQQQQNQLQSGQRPQQPLQQFRPPPRRRPPPRLSLSWHPARPSQRPSAPGWMPRHRRRRLSASARSVVRPWLQLPLTPTPSRYGPSEWTNTTKDPTDSHQKCASLTPPLPSPPVSSPLPSAWRRHLTTMMTTTTYRLRH